MEERTTPPQDAQAAGDHSARVKTGAASGAAGTGTATTVRAKLLSQTQSRNQLCTASFTSIPYIPLSPHSLEPSLSRVERDGHNGASAASSASAKAPGGEAEPEVRRPAQKCQSSVRCLLTCTKHGWGVGHYVTLFRS
eukprot:2758984-Pleurochrysis_carterae.AAC.1